MTPLFFIFLVSDLTATSIWPTLPRLPLECGCSCRYSTLGRVYIFLTTRYILSRLDRCWYSALSLRCGLQAIVQGEIRPWNGRCNLFSRHGSVSACVCGILIKERERKREDHSPRWHYLNRNRSEAPAWKPFGVQMSWQHILFKSLNSSLNLLLLLSCHCNWDFWKT